MVLFGEGELVSAGPRVASGRHDQRQFDEAILAGRVVDPLHGLAVIPGLSPEDVRYKSLRIAVVEGEPTGLDLHHEAMTGQKDVVRRGQIEAVEQGLIGSDGFGSLKTLAIAPAKDVGGNHQLVAAKGRLAGYFVRIDVNQLDDPVGVRAAGGGEHIGDRLPAYLQSRRQDVGNKHRYIRAAGRLALVVYEPLGPGQTATVADRLIGARAKRHGLRGVRYVFVERRVAGLGRSETQLETGGEIERRWPDAAAAGTAGGPGGQSPPGVGAGFKGGDGRYIRFGCTVFEILREERSKDLPAEVESRVAVEFQGAEGAAIADLLAVMPRAHDQEDFVVAGVLWLDGFVDGDGTVDVFLVPEAVDQHHRDLQGLRRQDLVHGLGAPEGVVAGMFEDFAPESDLLESMEAPELAGGPRLHELVVIIEVASPPFGPVVARGFLFVDVGHILLAEGAVVEPVVAHPAVDHGIHRHRHLERWVRIDERHQGREAVVGNAENADLAVAFRDVFHEPVDRVVRVGGVIDRSGVQGPAQGTIHHVVALGVILAAHILDHANVAAFQDDFGGVVVTAQGGAEMRACGVAGLLRGIVWRAGKK